MPAQANGRQAWPDRLFCGLSSIWRPRAAIVAMTAGQCTEDGYGQFPCHGRCTWSPRPTHGSADRLRRSGGVPQARLRRFLAETLALCVPVPDLSYSRCLSHPVVIRRERDSSRLSAHVGLRSGRPLCGHRPLRDKPPARSEEHTSELQSRENLVCRLLLEKKKR